MEALALGLDASVPLAIHDGPGEIKSDIGDTGELFRCWRWVAASMGFEEDLGAEGFVSSLSAEACERWMVAWRAAGRPDEAAPTGAQRACAGSAESTTPPPMPQGPAPRRRNRVYEKGRFQKLAFQRLRWLRDSQRERARKGYLGRFLQRHGTTSRGRRGCGPRAQEEARRARAALGEGAGVARAFVRLVVPGARPCQGPDAVERFRGQGAGLAARVLRGRVVGGHDGPVAQDHAQLVVALPPRVRQASACGRRTSGGRCLGPSCCRGCE